MKYLLKNNRDGAASVYRTTVEVSQDERNIYFNFVAEHSNYYCPYHNYNDIHSCGDAVEILIGIDSARKTYYELEVNPDNAEMQVRWKAFLRKITSKSELSFSDIVHYLQTALKPYWENLNHEWG